MRMPDRADLSVVDRRAAEFQRTLQSGLALDEVE